MALRTANQLGSAIMTENILVSHYVIVEYIIPIDTTLGPLSESLG